MPFSIVQVGSKLYRLETSGSSTELTLPTGATLATTRKPRFAVLERTVVMVNSPSYNLAIDPDGNVRSMTPRPPASAGRVAAGTSTGLTGAYKVKYSYRIKDANGKLLAESPLGPASNSVTLANTSLAGTNAPISADPEVNARGVYRTTAGGSTYFRWFDIDDNTVTAWEDNLSDAGLNVAANTLQDLGVPPGSSPGTRMELVTAWKGRLWGKGTDTSLVDSVFYTEDRKSWAWPEDNELIIPPAGQDAEGVTAFVARRDFLGVARRNSFYEIRTAGSGFQVSRVIDGKGLIAPDSVVVINDVGYGLGTDGVYSYGSGGFTSVSDEKVRAWFTTDTYFNRARFNQAFAGYNPDTYSYELHLAAAGSTSEDRWVSYCLRNNQWYGPHKTDAFTPKSRIITRDSNNNDVVYVGGDNGFLHIMNHATRTDGPTTPIVFNCQFIFHADTPDIEKMWGAPDILSRIESGGTATLTPTMGGLDATAGTALTIDLTKDRQRLERLGLGRYAQLTLEQAAAGRDILIYGMELPFIEWGRR